MLGAGQLCRVLVRSSACLGSTNKHGVNIFNYQVRIFVLRNTQQHQRGIVFNIHCSVGVINDWLSVLTHQTGGIQSLAQYFTHNLQVIYIVNVRFALFFMLLLCYKKFPHPFKSSRFPPRRCCTDSWTCCRRSLPGVKANCAWSAAPSSVWPPASITADTAVDSSAAGARTRTCPSSSSHWTSRFGCVRRALTFWP